MVLLVDALADSLDEVVVGGLVLGDLFEGKEEARRREGEILQVGKGRRIQVDVKILVSIVGQPSPRRFVPVDFDGVVGDG